jgi:hypothetical protein
MTIASQTRMIDELTEEAATALAASHHFKAEALAHKALLLAHDDGDFSRMTLTLPTLREARLYRLNAALKVGTLLVVDVPFEDDVTIEPGCYLLQPPLVGAHARRLRLMAVSREINAVVLCREPVIRLGLVPFVALGTGATVRTKMKPPADIENPDLDWFKTALDALGEAAAELDPAMNVQKRINALMPRVDAIPEHEALNQFLEDSCREAAEADANAAKS